MILRWSIEPEKSHVNADTMSRVPQTSSNEEICQNDVQSSYTKSQAQAEFPATVFMTTIAQPAFDLIRVQHDDPITKQLINWKQENARKPKLDCRPTNPKLRCLLNQ